MEKDLTTLLGFTFTRIAFHVHTKVQVGKFPWVCLFLSDLRLYSVAGCLLLRLSVLPTTYKGPLAVILPPTPLLSVDFLPVGTRLAIA